MNKHQRKDLTLAHLVARAGVIKDFSKDDLLIKNKNNWLPVHLSKNKHIAELLFTETKYLIEEKEILPYCLYNNAESIQTKYGKDLFQFLLENDFSEQEARIASVEPKEKERIELSKFYLSMINKNNISFFENNILDIALKNCNVYFFFALNEVDNKNLILGFFQNTISSKIGSDFYLKDRAFQTQQQLKQFFNINIEITQNIPVNYDDETSDSLKNLEGA